MQPKILLVYKSNEHTTITTVLCDKLEIDVKNEEMMYVTVKKVIKVIPFQSIEWYHSCFDIYRNGEKK